MSERDRLNLREFQGMLAAWATAVVVLALSAVTAAQGASADPHAAQPERPTVATNAATVAPGWIEMESGVERDALGHHAHSESIPMVIKLGIAQRLQLDVQLPVAFGAVDDGVDSVFAGLKWRIADHAWIFDEVAVVPSLRMPVASTATRDANLVLVSSHEIGPVSMDVNIALTRRGGDGIAAARSTGLWTTAFGGPAGQRLGWVAEVFGRPAISGPDGDAATVAFLGGPTLKLRKWLVADSGVIVPLAGPQPKALYAGVVYNVGRLFNTQPGSSPAASRTGKPAGASRGSQRFLLP